jgi:hypothetical protein
MYELYSEILYEILNAVGSDAAIKGGREALVCYLQEAFNIDSDEHALLLGKTKERKVQQNMCKWLISTLNKRRQYTYNVTEAGSRNHCCRGKEINTTYFCVGAWAYARARVALLIQHERRMCRIILSSVASLAPPHFGKKKLLTLKCVLDFLYNFYLKHFSTRWSQMWKRLHEKHPLFFSTFE